MKKHLTKAIFILSISPLSVFAAVQDFSVLGDFINNIKNNVIVNLSALFLTTAVVAFFYGVVHFLIANHNGEAKGMTDGKNFMLWGLIALFAMFSVWGIVTFAQKTLGIQGQTQIDIPSIRFQDTGGAQASPNNGLGSTADTGLGSYFNNTAGANNSSLTNQITNQVTSGSGNTSSCQTVQLDSSTGFTRYYDASNNCSLVMSISADGTKYDSTGNLITSNNSQVSGGGQSILPKNSDGSCPSGYIVNMSNSTECIK